MHDLGDADRYHSQRVLYDHGRGGADDEERQRHYSGRHWPLPGSFTVTGPTVAAITPTSGTHNTSLGVAITGSDLTGATSVTAGSGITASNIVVNAAGTELTATFTITNGAAHTARNVRVVTPNGTTPVNAAVTFGVN